jgi:hypothetical protein
MWVGSLSRDYRSILGLRYWYLARRRSFLVEIRLMNNVHKKRAFIESLIQLRGKQEFW